MDVLNENDNALLCCSHTREHLLRRSEQTFVEPRSTWLWEETPVRQVKVHERLTSKDAAFVTIYSLAVECAPLRIMLLEGRVDIFLRLVPR